MFDIVSNSDYLWLRAVVLTNATVATVGLGLTIPLAFISDLVMKQPNVLTPSSVCGALTVLVGFVLVNIGNDEENETETPIEMASRSHEPLRGDENNDETDVVSSPTIPPVS
jgi:solute carrier family 35 protein F5